MLKDSLYIISKISQEDKLIEALIELNANHELFAGHFPGQPVLPGACMLQMVKEILQSHFNKNLQLIKADDIRFLIMINPHESRQLKFLLQYKIAEQLISIDGKIIKDDISICCKMKAAFNFI